MRIEGFREIMLGLRNTEFAAEYVADPRIGTAKAARKALLLAPVELARKYGATNAIPVVIEADRRRVLINSTLNKLEYK
jgi:hypothetical protein